MSAVLGVGAAVVAGAWWVAANWPRLARQWACHRVGNSATFDEARAAIAAMDRGPDRDALDRELVAQWSTGNPRFDLFLAGYVGQAQSSDFLREAFSLELAWRTPLSGRWAQYWLWRGAQEPDEELASLVTYLDLLAACDPPRRLSWREVLDVQALFTLTGRESLGYRLLPENWHDRYRQWLAVRPASLPHVARPDYPFPDWQGAAPDRARVVGR
jgi:hypothetical protein